MGCTANICHSPRTLHLCHLQETRYVCIGAISGSSGWKRDVEDGRNVCGKGGGGRRSREHNSVWLTNSDFWRHISSQKWKGVFLSNLSSWKRDLIVSGFFSTPFLWVWTGTYTLFLLLKTLCNCQWKMEHIWAKKCWQLGKDQILGCVVSSVWIIRIISSL